MHITKILVPVVTLSLVGASILSVGQVYAQSHGSPTLVQAIAQKFGLNQSQVQSVFDQYKQQRQANVQQRLNDRLTKLVQNGKITDAQKTAILAEVAKLKSEYNAQSFKNMTLAQRKQAFQKEQAEIDSWSKSHGINPMYLRVGWGIPRSGWVTVTPTPSP